MIDALDRDLIGEVVERALTDVRVTIVPDWMLNAGLKPPTPAELPGAPQGEVLTVDYPRRRDLADVLLRELEAAGFEIRRVP